MGSAGYSAANNKMYWRMYAGHNCTNYAAYRMVKSGLPNTRPWSGGGNATYWGTSMPTHHRQGARRRRRRLVEGQHRPGRARPATWRTSRRSSPPTQIIISQDSWGGDFSWAVITKASGNWPSGFIHFNDQAGQQGCSGRLRHGEGRRQADRDRRHLEPDGRQDQLPVVRQRRRRSRTRPSRPSPSPVRGSARRSRSAPRRPRSATPPRPRRRRPPRRSCPASWPAPSTPLLSGVVKVDSTLSLNPGAWNVTPDSTTVQWYADGAADRRRGRHHPPARPRSSRAAAISATVTATRAGYSTRSRVTTPRDRARSRSAPSRSGRTPALSGTAKPGQVLDRRPRQPTAPATRPCAIQWLRDGRRSPTRPARRTGSALPTSAARVSASVTVSRAGYETTTLTTPDHDPGQGHPADSRSSGCRLKHGVRLRFTVSSRAIPRVDGTVVVRVAGRLPSGDRAPQRRRPGPGERSCRKG